jgi:hypothetical protein
MPLIDWTVHPEIGFCGFACELPQKSHKALAESISTIF